jgi:hypothetical protein
MKKEKVEKKKASVPITLSCDVIKIFKTESVDKYNRVDLRVVKWSNGKVRVLEKRRVWTLKDGTLRHRKMVGLSVLDLKFIIENKEEIIVSMGDSNG